MQQLAEQGIFAYGSAELNDYERRLTRYFSREYTAYLKHQPVGQEQRITASTGPISVQNNDLMENHYDRQLPLFESFLDRRYLAYTMAYYGDQPDQIVNRNCSLEDAQERKFRLICRRAGITGREEVLNLGCGFGSFETYLLENYPDIRVTSLTSSRVQADYMTRCFDDAQHPLNREQCQLVHGVFGDTRANLPQASYDKVFAIGLFEHLHNLRLAFSEISNLLRPGGRCFLHLIVSVPTFPHYQDSNNTLLGKYFPGGRIWPFALLAQKQDYFRLLDSWYLNGMNYWRTLDEWHQRYWTHIEALYGTCLDKAEVRHWNDYFILCKVVLFAPLNGQVYGNGHYLFEKNL